MAAPRIEDYRFGRINVDGRTYTNDLIICPDGVKPGWWRREGHGLHPDDLASIIGLAPDILIIGSGVSGILNVPNETRDWIQEKDIELLVLPTPEACKRYNELAAVKKVIAGLHLTC